ncbi:hypothetical protein SAMN05216499_1169 [Actinacidiphila paucisporea]|uniref:Uncharacterized protein n=1 Tax=Actinacidiphila paucisporea TaxID=310782 RepID=A0A1M7MEF8_9ACTN|nr:hypothetical protein SAMN05216499_1169 [Actinacidiphila paucisporea]
MGRYQPAQAHTSRISQVRGQARRNHKRERTLPYRFDERTADDSRLTAFDTNTADIPIGALELRHHQRPHAEDRVRAARATGLRNLPLHDTALFSGVRGTQLTVPCAGSAPLPGPLSSHYLEVKIY